MSQLHDGTCSIPPGKRPKLMVIPDHNFTVRSHTTPSQINSAYAMNYIRYHYFRRITLLKRAERCIIVRGARTTGTMLITVSRFKEFVQSRLLPDLPIEW